MKNKHTNLPHKGKSKHILKTNQLFSAMAAILLYFD